MMNAAAAIGKEEESGAVAAVVNDGSRNHLAQRSTDSDGGGDRSLRQVEASGATREVGDDQDGNHAEDARSHAIKNLYADQEGKCRA